MQRPLDAWDKVLADEEEDDKEEEQARTPLHLPKPDLAAPPAPRCATAPAERFHCGARWELQPGDAAAESTSSWSVYVR